MHTIDTGYSKHRPAFFISSLINKEATVSYGDALLEEKHNDDT